MKITEYENYQEKREHAESDFPYITYPCSIPLDFSRVPLHWHDEMELIYIKKGRGIVQVDSQTYHTGAGDILIIIPGHLHAIRQEKTEQMEYENIIFNPTLLLSQQPDLCSSSFFQPMLQNQLAIPIYLNPTMECHAAISQCLDRADQLCQLRPFGYQIALKAQLLEFFFQLFSNASSLMDPQEGSAHTPKPHELEKMKLILKYIETHYDERITIEEIADVCNFSQSHFMKFFKQTFGRSFITYLKEYRLIMASRLLLTSSAPILEIAERTGFDNLSYFNRSFKAMYQQTPREFRDRK